MMTPLPFTQYHKCLSLLCPPFAVSNVVHNKQEYFEKSVLFALSKSIQKFPAAENINQHFPFLVKKIIHLQ